MQAKYSVRNARSYGSLERRLADLAYDTRVFATGRFRVAAPLFLAAFLAAKASFFPRRSKIAVTVSCISLVRAGGNAHQPGDLFSGRKWRCDSEGLPHFPVSLVAV